MKYTKSYIEEIIRFYVENPIYLFPAVALSFLFLAILLNIFPDWTIYQYMTLWLISIPTFILIIGHIVGYLKETKLEKEYDEILEKPFEQKFIIPSIRKYKINYDKQTNKRQLKDKIKIPANIKATIIFRTNTILDLEIRDSQYNFGRDGHKKKPEIIRYKNPFYKGRTSLTKWFNKDLGYDWNGLYHLSGKRLMFTDKTYIDGFEIKTYDKGEFTFDMNFLILCKKFKNLEKEKSKHIRTNLRVNVI